LTSEATRSLGNTSPLLTDVRFALDGSFIIAFFVGDFDPESVGTGWLHESNLAGSSAIFASSQARIESGNCENCEAQQSSGKKYYDTVGLTQALATYWKSGKEGYGLRVTSLEPDVVIPFLTRNLHWRVFDVRIQLLMHR
jgi:tyrosinase